MNTNEYDYAKEQKEATIKNTCYILDEQTVRDFVKWLEEDAPVIGKSVGNALRLLQKVAQESCYSISKLVELQQVVVQVVVDEVKEIAELEHRKKHCKNYLELKQINKRLNVLKFKQSKRRVSSVHERMY